MWKSSYCVCEIIYSVLFINEYNATSNATQKRLLSDLFTFVLNFHKYIYCWASEQNSESLLSCISFVGNFVQLLYSAIFSFFFLCWEMMLTYNNSAHSNRGQWINLEISERNIFILINFIGFQLCTNGSCL